MVSSTIPAPLNEEGLVRDEQTNEVFLLFTSTVVLKRKQEMLFVPLFRELSNSKCLGRLKSLRQCNHPERPGYNKTVYYSQNR